MVLNRQGRGAPARPLVAAAFVLAALAPLSASLAAPVQTGLERAAVAVRQPARVVMLGIAAAGPRLVAVGERGVVALSDDGGQQWRQAQVPVSVTLTSVRFADDRVGLATGHGGVVLATSDQGATWKLVLDGRRIAQTVLAQARSSGNGQAVKEAERLVTDGPDKPLLDLVVLDPRRAWVVGAYGLALATEDGGNTWTSWADRLDNPQGHHLYAVRKRGDTVLLAGEQGLLFLSTDGGRSFKRLESPYRGSWFTAELSDDQTLLVAGLRGNAWRSVDGGANWVALATPMGASITASTLSADGRVLLANQAGFVMSVEGDRLVPMQTTPLPSVAGLSAWRGQVMTVGLRGVRALPNAAAGAGKPGQERGR